MATTEERPEAEMAEEHEETTTTPRKPAERRDDAPPEADDEKQRLRAALSKANKEAADRRRRLEELERAEEERKTATLTEAEKVRKAAKDAEAARVEAERRAVDAEAALTEERLKSAVERTATTMGFDYPDIAPSLIDRSRPLIDEETGKPDPKAIKDALERLLRDKPGLAGAAPRGGTPPREGPRRTSGGRQGAPEVSIHDKLRESGRYGV